MLALALIVLGIIMIIANSSERKLAEQLELGQKYLDEMAYETAIEIDPKCEEAYLALAEAYLQMGKYDKAMECASQGYSRTGSEKFLGKMEEIQDLMTASLQNDESVGARSLCNWVGENG